MAANSIIPPYPIFFEADGTPLESGYIYIGEAGYDAETLPKASFFDLALSIPTPTGSGGAIRTTSGYPVNNGSAVMVYVDGDFSITVKDRNGVLIFSSLNRTFAYSIADATGNPILAPDGNFANAGFGFINEQNTGLVRQGVGVVQAVVLGNVIYQWSATGMQFLLPPSGAGFVTGVDAALDQDLKDIAAITPSEGDLIFRNATAWVRRPKGTAGQVLRQNDALTIPVWSDAITSRPPQATTSGSNFDFLTIPPWVQKITVSCAGISLTGSASFLVQLGTSASFINTGYASGGGSFTGGATAVVTASDGFVIRSGGAGEGFTGHMTLIKSGTTWVSSYSGAGISPSIGSGGGQVTIAEVITRLRLTQTGADTFDAGSVSIIYE